MLRTVLTTFSLLALVSSAGCITEDDGDGGSGGSSDAASETDVGDAAGCPTGPSAPLGLECSDESQQCAYGYDPPECGGRTVVCDGGVWNELTHTDPQASCFDAADVDIDGGNGDADIPDDSSDMADAEPEEIPCGELTCSPNQYCFVRCTCCGADTGQPPSADYECRDIPTSCLGAPLCDCDQVNDGGGWCDENGRTYELPCA